MSAEPSRKPFCSTCGKDVAEILCPTCAKWWADNPPPSLPDGVGEIVGFLRDTEAEIDADWAADVQQGSPLPRPKNWAGEAADTIVALQARVAALEGGLRPFAELAQGETFEPFAIRSSEQFLLCRPADNKRYALVTAECFRVARALLADAKDGDVG